MYRAEPSGPIVIINDFSTARGGATTLALALAMRLRNRGFDVVFFTGDSGKNPALEASGARIVALGQSELLAAGGAALWRGLYNAEAKAALDALIDEVGEDAVFHLHGWAQIFSPSIFAALDRVANRTVATCHDFFLACPNGNYTIYPRSKLCEFTPMSPTCLMSDCDKRNYAHKVWRLGRQAVLRGAMKKPFRLLTIHRDMAPMLARAGLAADRMTAIANPVEPSAQARVEAEKNEELVYIGRLEHEKGADLAAAAARRAGAPFRVIGDGTRKDDVRRANPDAIFDGWLERGEIDSRLRRARLVVAPSRCLEPFGLAAVEALSAGVPAIVSRSLLIGRDIGAHDMGAQIDVFDIDAFAGLLGELRRDDARVRRMSENAFAHARDISLSYEQWVDAQVAVYVDIRRAFSRDPECVPA